MTKSPRRKQLEADLAKLKPCNCPCVTVPDRYWRHKVYDIATKAGIAVTTRKVNGGYQVRRVQP